jgi:L-ectoine synthase
MKIKRISEIEGVKFTGGTSFRALLAKDEMGFSIMKTVIPKGGPHHWHYQNHLEACYCIKGKGEIVDLQTGFKSLITPDVVYVLDSHEDHTFEALEDTVLISVFNPPLQGNEKHDKDGVYGIPENNPVLFDSINKVTKC